MILDELLLPAVDLGIQRLVDLRSEIDSKVSVSLHKQKYEKMLHTALQPVKEVQELEQSGIEKWVILDCFYKEYRDGERRLLIFNALRPPT